MIGILWMGLAIILGLCISLALRGFDAMIITILVLQIVAVRVNTHERKYHKWN